MYCAGSSALKKQREVHVVDGATDGGDTGGQCFPDRHAP